MVLPTVPDKYDAGNNKENEKLFIIMHSRIALFALLCLVLCIVSYVTDSQMTFV